MESESQQTPRTAAHAPITPATGGESFVHRELNGATFLTLEHVAHMALVVVVSALILAGIMAALTMWAGLPSVINSLTLFSGSSVHVMDAVMALAVVAALLVLAPALLVLDRRTRAEWHKRPGYAGRLAYKVPVYTALAILGVLTVGSVIEMIYVVITSLAFIGMANAPISTMYLDTFLPAAISFVVFAATAWYVFNLAKGRDYGKKFSMAVGAISIAAVVSLFITSLTVLHSGDNSFSAPSPSTIDPYSSSSSHYYQDLLNQLQQ